jgi:beta-glucosidase
VSSQSPNFQVTFDLANTGAVAGAEVAQVYLGFPPNAGEPPKRLVGWQKVFLQPGQTLPVTVEVDSNDSSHPMSIWDTASNRWTSPKGDYSVYVGNSSREQDLQLAGTLKNQ